MPSRWFPALAAPSIGWAAYRTVPAMADCPGCCYENATTLTNEINGAGMVLFGTLDNAKGNADDSSNGTTELHIEVVFKGHDILARRKVIVVSRYIQPAEKGAKWLVFFDVDKGKAEAYRGIPFKDAKRASTYLKGVLDLDGKPVPDRLKFVFDYLNSADDEIAKDAYREFANASYKDFCEAAKCLSAEKVAERLEDPNTSPYHLGLYATALGHCGNERHAAVLRKLIDGADHGLDGMFVAYVMLKPTEGEGHVRRILKDESKNFNHRFAAMRAARFFVENRPELMHQKKVVEAVCLLLDQSDIADLAIDDLRKWGRVEMTDRVLGLADRKSHDIPIVRRTILKFALSFPRNARAAFVKEQRKKDPEGVAEMEELLRLDSVPVPLASGVSPKKTKAVARR